MNKILIATFLFIPLCGCEMHHRGPAERAGQHIDDTASAVHDSARRVGENAREAGENVKDRMTHDDSAEDARERSHSR